MQQMGQPWMMGKPWMTGQPSMMAQMTFPPLLATVQQCQNVCEHMMTMMLGAPDVQNRRIQIQLLHDCAAICKLLAGYLASGSPFVRAVANQCAAICEMCGNECARFQDQHSQMCSQVCMHCAQECRTFSRG